MIVRGRNCQCGRWVPGFANKCLDCGTPAPRMLVENLLRYLTGGANERGGGCTRPSARGRGTPELQKKLLIEAVKSGVPVPKAALAAEIPRRMAYAIVWKEGLIRKPGRRPVLADDIVRAVRRRVGAGEERQHIAADLKISEALISNIHTGKSYRHVP